MMAEEVYHYLRSAGVLCFFSGRSIDEEGSADYKARIDAALDGCQHMAVITSSAEHPSKRWVRYEWDTFSNEKLSGRKNGNLVLVACGPFSIGRLPLGLRSVQALQWPDHKDRLLHYFGDAGSEHGVPNIGDPPPVKQNVGLADGDGKERVEMPTPLRDPLPRTSLRLGHGQIAKKSGWSVPRLLARLFVFYWRPPIWRPTATATGIRRLSVVVGDVIVRIFRLYLLFVLTIVLPLGAIASLFE